MSILDVSDPSAPSLRSTFGTGIMSLSEMRVRLTGSTAIVGSLDAVISVDLGDPDNPVELDRVDTDGLEITALELIDDRAYVFVAGFIRAIAISNLTSPTMYWAPAESRWWHPGVVVGDTLLRPSGPFLDVVSFEWRPPTADFRWDGLGLDIHFVDLRAYTDSSHTWRFGDGIGLSTPGFSARHEYTGPGSYEVTLTVWSSQGSDTVVKTVEVGTRVFWDGFETGDLIAWDQPDP